MKHILIAFFIVLLSAACGPLPQGKETQGGFWHTYHLVHLYGEYKGRVCLPFVATEKSKERLYQHTLDLLAYLDLPIYQYDEEENEWIDLWENNYKPLYSPCYGVNVDPPFETINQVSE